MAEGTEAGEAMSKRTAVYDLYLRGDQTLPSGSANRERSRALAETATAVARRARPRPWAPPIRVPNRCPRVAVGKALHGDEQC